MTGRRLLGGLGALALAGVLLAGLMAPVAAGAAVVATRATESVGAAGSRLADGRVRAASVLLDDDGVPMAELYERYRLPVGGGQISNAMKAAVVAVEDRRFFDHDGVDYAGLARALASNAVSGSPLEGQGASTITMQYVKNYRLYAVARTTEQRRAAAADTVARKLTEVRLAHRVESRLSKDRILARYLDLVYFGHGAYGVEAAARVYFGTTAAALDVGQAALLAGLVRSPAGYDPTTAPEAATARRATVLDAMAEVGSITRGQAEAARARPLGIRADARPPAEGCAGARPGTGFFCRYVVDTLATQGLDAADLRTGGYTVRTTLDQTVSGQALAATSETVGGGGSDVADVTAVIAPDAGRRPVLALAANRAYGDDAASGQSAYPLPTAPLRGAGSVYKIFTATAALEAGLVEPDTTIDVPDRYTARSFTDGGEAYTVTNLGSYDDEMTLRRALATSPNTAFVALEDRLGSVAPIVDAARRLGLRQTLAAPTASGEPLGDTVVDQQRASFTLGPEPTSPLELANVGATIVRGGMWCAPTPLDRVTDREGRELALPEPACERAVSPDTADDLETGLSDDHVDGTSADAADDAGWEGDMIGKTGTTQESASAAFLGATDRYAASVMTFSDRGAPRPVCTDPVRTCADGDLTGGSVPAETWYTMLTPLHPEATTGDD